MNSKSSLACKDVELVSLDDVLSYCRCKECGASFPVKKSEVEAIKRKVGEDNFSMPRRCPTCRPKKTQVYRTLTCRLCKKSFDIMLLEKEEYVRNGLELPSHCSDCRSKRKSKSSKTKME